MENAVIADAFKQALVAALGADCVLTGDAIPARNLQDRSHRPPRRPRALLLPRDAAAVSRAMQLCAAHAQPVTVQGGMTGLVGGAWPDCHEVALSLERLNGIVACDPAGATITALAGTPLETVQQAARQAGMLYGVDLGARGSCTIGGTIATNAGGNQVLRYGMTRANVLGLEVVLADGRIVRCDNRMMKNNAGYDWTQCFIGSEGTLGIVTQATLRLHPLPAQTQTVAFALQGLPEAQALLQRLQTEFPGQLLAFEAMWEEYARAVTSVCGATAPFAPDTPLVVLAELMIGARPEHRDLLEQVMGDWLEQGVCQDVIVAQSLQQAASLWAWREKTAEFRTFGRRVHGLDISLPGDAMSDAIAHLRSACAQQLPGLTVFWFGHLADGNIHVCAAFEGAAQDQARQQRLDDIVYACVATHGGSVSAEHGIGRHKRSRLSLSRNSQELALMRLFKQALDPMGILNPDRVLGG